MKSQKHRRLLVSLIGFVWLFTACASLKPSAASVAPETGGGLEVSDETTGIIGCLGYVAYFAGQFFGCNHP